jgi:hypothetical protein
MELFGAKFSVALGAWKLRFVLMLEDEEELPPSAHAAYRTPHHFSTMRNHSHSSS